MIAKPSEKCPACEIPSQDHSGQSWLQGFQDLHASDIFGKTVWHQHIGLEHCGSQLSGRVLWFGSLHPGRVKHLQKLLSLPETSSADSMIPPEPSRFSGSSHFGDVVPSVVKGFRSFGVFLFFQVEAAAG